jgi:multidrug efflux pump subunit AcrA (membrane-fusion protein)
MKRKFYFLILIATMVMACHNNQESSDEEEEQETQTPVTVTSVSFETLADSLELNATSNFLQDNIIKSNISGYIKTIGAKVNDYVNAGEILFTLKTKEAESLGNTINKLDSSFNFSGTVKITAAKSGYITALDHQAGDYVQEGEQLAVISDVKSFGFVLNVPYEEKKYVTLNKPVDVLLPDGTHLNGVVISFMPVIDSVSQTQPVLVKVPSSSRIPENLIAKIKILKNRKADVASVPKQALLTDESQSQFWIMKLIDSVTAVKVPVTKGMEVNDRVEIIQPLLSSQDKILLNGNYGLPDTAKVKVVKSVE